MKPKRLWIVAGMAISMGGCAPLPLDELPDGSQTPGATDIPSPGVTATPGNGTPTSTPSMSPTTSPSGTPSQTDSPTGSPTSPTPGTATPSQTVTPTFAPTPTGTPGPADEDGDGYTVPQGDCNDANPAAHPGAAEVCDTVDNDCDGQVDEVLPAWYYDGDHDGYGSTSVASISSCTQPMGYVSSGGDCNDANLQINPGAPELCNGQDEDCDGLVDDGLTFSTYYSDSDLDGYGDASSALSACSKPKGYVTDNTDCDDADENTYPNAPAILCDGIDEGCLGLEDDAPDADLDGYDLCDAEVPGSDGLVADCDDANNAIHPSASEVIGDGIDQDCNGYADTLVLVAGRSPGEGGDGGAATSAQLFLPTDVKVSSSGDLYIADRFNHRIRKVTSAGIISTVAGTGEAGYNGDNIAATTAKLFAPQGIAVSGNDLYIADTSNHRIRKVSSSGTITTVAGTGVSGFAGDGASATAALLAQPGAVSVTSGNSFYIADTANYRIRKVDSSGNISTVAGTGEAGYSGDGSAATSARLNYPQGIVATSSNTFYFSDTLNHCIRKVSSGNISTVTGTGVSGAASDPSSASSATFNTPFGLTADSNGNLVIADFGNSRVRKYDSENKNITTLIGVNPLGYSGDGQTASVARVDGPAGVAQGSNGDVYFADYYNNRIRKVTSGGSVSTVVGSASPGFSGDGSEATLASLTIPTSVAYDKSGNLFIADNYNCRIRKVTPAGVISTFAGTGNYTGALGDGGQATSALVYYPYGVAADSKGNVFIAEGGSNRVRKVALDGVITTVAGTGTGGYNGDGIAANTARLYSPTSIAFQADGSYLIADVLNQRIRKVDTSGIITTVAGTGTAGFSGDGGDPTSAQLREPFSVAVATDGAFYIADRTNQRVRKVLDGKISTVAGNGTAGSVGDGGPATSASLNYPLSVAVDAAGNLFIADGSNHRVRMVTPSGTITTVGGRGAIGYEGVNGRASSAELFQPYGVGIDPSGYPVIADSYNNRIVKIVW